MPLYEYDCPGCGQPFEKRVRMSEADNAPPCPNCGNKHARRKLSRIAIKGQTASASGAGVVSLPPGGG